MSGEFGGCGAGDRPLRADAPVVEPVPPTERAGDDEENLKRDIGIELAGENKPPKSTQPRMPVHQVWMELRVASAMEIEVDGVGDDFQPRRMAQDFAQGIV